MDAQYKGQGLAVVKIHSPEFGWEKERDTVIRYAERFKLTEPIYLDSDLAYWNALDNQYWPAFYLVDKRGTIRKQAVGEMHRGEAQADGFEQEIARLLREPS
jgi:hypothetical protein